MRKIKGVTFAIAVVLALTAFANAASASTPPSGFKAAEYPFGGVNLIAENAGEFESSRFNAFGTFAECQAPHVESTRQGGPSPTLDAETTWGHTCIGGPWGKAQSMAVNCDFIVDPGPAPTYAGTVTIGPGGCEMEDPEMFFGCTAKIKPTATFAATAAFEQKGNNVNIRVNSTGWDVTLVHPKGGSGECWGFKHTEYGEWQFEWTVSAKDEVGKTQALEMMAELPYTDIHIGTKASEKESKQPYFQAEFYNRGVGGDNALPTFETSIGKVTCSDSGIHGEIWNAAVGIAFYPTYYGCAATINGTAYSVEIAMNGCNYAVNLNIGYPYTGAFGVFCPPYGNKVEYRMKKEGVTACTLIVNQQSSVGNVSLANVTSGTKRTISMSGSLTGVKWEGCGSSGTGTQAVSTTLTGGKPTY